MAVFAWAEYEASGGVRDLLAYITVSDPLDASAVLAAVKQLPTGWGGSTYILALVDPASLREVAAYEFSGGANDDLVGWHRVSAQRAAGDEEGEPGESEADPALEAMGERLCTAMVTGDWSDYGETKRTSPSVPPDS